MLGGVDWVKSFDKQLSRIRTKAIFLPAFLAIPQNQESRLPYLWIGAWFLVELLWITWYVNQL